VLKEFLTVQAIQERAEDSMRRLIASEFVTLDGVMEAPGHDEHRDGKNAWALRYAGHDQQRYKAEELAEAGAILLGRVTYEIFALFWPMAPTDEGFADRMNSIPKYVVSKSLRTAGWQNSIIIGGNPGEKIAELKQQAGGDILLFGSGDLLNSLIKHDLIDEYRLMVFPWCLEVASVSSAMRPTSRTCSSSTPGPSSPESPCSLTGQRTESHRANTWRRSPGRKSRCDPGKRRRTPIASLPPCCSPTSSGRPSKQPRSAIRDGAGSWIDMTE
jgi:dihydrofolate reductase